MSRWQPIGRSRHEELSDAESPGFHPTTKHTPADVASPSDTSAPGGDEGYESRRASHYESSHALHGQLMSTHGAQTPGPFTVSNGMHSVGADHIACFSRSVRFAGLVRQGPGYTSEQAPGVARADTHGSDIPVHRYSSSSPNFEQRQHSRWAGNGG